MISSSFMWGFLCDTLGRKRLMVIGYLLDAVFVIMSSFSQNYTFLLIFKFLGGFIINGPFSALTAYLSEFHCSKYRSRVQLVRGTIISCGTMVLPLLAWAILPQKIVITLFNNSVVLRPWNLFLLVCAIPSLVSGIIFIFMPESPKFLMTVGRNEEALAVFRTVYALNTGNNKQNFPIQTLLDETKTEGREMQKHGGHITAGRSKTQALREGFQQIKPLCFPPHLKHIILVCCMQSLIMSGANTLRLWLPQIFQAISDYEYYNNGSTASLCDMLEALETSTQSDICYVNFSPTVYVNTIIVASVTIFGFAVVGSLINKLGKKTLLGILAFSGGMCAMSMYFAQNTAVVVVLSSLFLSAGGIAGNVLLTIIIDLFPTSLRVVTISLVLMFGPLASMTGNLVFPLLLSLGCAPPFFTLGCALIVCSFLVMILPNTERKALN
ncbi:synaptic vesicle glycoprotein 2C-like isoform X2 [Zophobas morio]